MRFSPGILRRDCRSHARSALCFPCQVFRNRSAHHLFYSVYAIALRRVSKLAKVDLLECCHGRIWPGCLTTWRERQCTFWTSQWSNLGHTQRARGSRENRQPITIGTSRHGKRPKSLCAGWSEITDGMAQLNTALEKVG